jgi:hypothetical protein
MNHNLPEVFNRFGLSRQIIKFKRQALEEEDSPENENKANARIEDDLYQNAIAKFPELANIDREEVLSKMRALQVNKPEVAPEEDVPTRKIFIDHVLCNDTKFTDSEVRDHVYTIVAAGSETTALQTAHTSEIFMQISVGNFGRFVSCKHALDSLLHQSCCLRHTQKSRKKSSRSSKRCFTRKTLRSTTTT